MPGMTDILRRLPRAGAIGTGAQAALLRAGALAARRLPLKVSYAIARGGGNVAYWLWPGGRRRCQEHMLRVCSGDRRAARRAARRSFGNYGLFLVDFLRQLTASPDETAARLRFSEWQRIHDLRSGNGIVFVTMHFGNWELGAAALALAGFGVSVVADQFGSPALNELVQRSRRHLGMTVIPSGRVGPGVLRALRRNDALASLADVPPAEGQGVAVDFCGARLLVPDGAARLALHAGAPVVVALLPRRRPWSEVVEAWIEPIAFTPSGQTEEDAGRLTQEIFRRLEGLVRRAPEQWYIFRRLPLAVEPTTGPATTGPATTGPAAPAGGGAGR